MFSAEGRPRSVRRDRTELPAARGERVQGANPSHGIRLARGALCADGDRWYRIELPARLDHPVVDTTGAGDCFNAGLIAGLRRGLDLPEAAALGCAAGTASTAAVGGSGARIELTAVLALAGRVSIRPVRPDVPDGSA